MVTRAVGIGSRVTPHSLRHACATHLLCGGSLDPYVAKLESGRIKNLGLKTLMKCARALGGTVTLKIEPRKRVTVPARRARTRAIKKPA